jgi:hypothetical protein
MIMVVPGVRASGTATVVQGSRGNGRENDAAMMQYKMSAAAQFTVRCDPPYENDDGGHGELLETVTTDAVTVAVSRLLSVTELGRLAPDQAPMIIEIRRVV